MAKYLFVYHGGKHPESEAEYKEVMDAWGSWFASMGSAVIDGGNPVGQSSTVHTRSPGVKRVTAGPTAATMPLVSVPGTKGSGGLRWYLPCTTRLVAKLTPAA